MQKTVTRRPIQHSEGKGLAPPVLRLVYSPALGVVREHLLPLLVGDNPLGRECGDPEGRALPEDPTLSRKHAILAVKTTSSAHYAVTVRDLNSRNGTFVNQEKVEGEAVPLRIGDVLRAGDTFFVLATPAATDAAIPTIVGDSAAASTLRARLSRLAASKANVLLLGETGTGKEVAARALHEHSGRTGAFVAVNCGAIPETLGESLLFGKLPGEFTGGKKSEGYFRAADGGTLFFDEIGDLPWGLQVKFLRVLEERAVLPLGASLPVPVDVRVIAATNRDLSRDMAEGRFREDLYARLEDEVVQLPSLRSRREDILPLFQHGYGADELLPALDADLVDALLHYGYPRNIRELLKLAAHLRNSGSAAELRDRLRPTSPTPTAMAIEGTKRRNPLIRPSRSDLEDVLRKHSGVIQHAAFEIGCSARHLGRWLEEVGIDAAVFRPQRSS